MGFDQIRYWVRYTEDGRAREHADIDPDGFQVDHVISEVSGGPTHYFNAHLMPASHNSQFNGWWTAEKQNYVGEQAVRAARGRVLGATVAHRSVINNLSHCLFEAANAA